MDLLFRIADGDFHFISDANLTQAPHKIMDIQTEKQFWEVVHELYDLLI